MKLKLDFFKPSGKWYADTIIEVGELKLHHADVYDKICDTQKEVLHPRTYIIVVCAVYEQDEFFTHLFHPTDTGN